VAHLGVGGRHDPVAGHPLPQRGTLAVPTGAVDVLGQQPAEQLRRLDALGPISNRGQQPIRRGTILASSARRAPGSCQSSLGLACPR
jgi:hypothetical protein